MSRAYFGGRPGGKSQLDGAKLSIFRSKQTAAIVREAIAMARMLHGATGMYALQRQSKEPLLEGATVYVNRGDFDGTYRVMHHMNHGVPFASTKVSFNEAENGN